MGSKNELDPQIHRRVMTSSTVPAPEYSSSVVDFQLLYEHILKNWPYEQKMKFREELEPRLKTALSVETGVPAMERSNEPGNGRQVVAGWLRGGADSPGVRKRKCIIVICRCSSRFAGKWD